MLARAVITMDSVQISKLLCDGLNCIEVILCVMLVLYSKQLLAPSTKFWPREIFPREHA